MSEPVSKLVEGQPVSAYGEAHSAHTFEIYKIAVEMADRISARRQLVNSFFLTLTTSLTALVGYTRLGSNNKDNLESLALMAFAGMVVAALWLLMIRSFNQLNAAKFRVILEIEESLPIRPFYAERELYKGAGRSGFTRIEAGVPWLFVVVHVFVFLVAMMSLVSQHLR
jgi:hypothetical protein